MHDPKGRLLASCGKLFGMTVPHIITLIDLEIAQLQSARALLTGAQPKPKVGRPVGTRKKKKRNLSPEGRARIAAAVKARWARQKKTAK
jgi:hypothetical protein